MGTTTKYQIQLASNSKCITEPSNSNENLPIIEGEGGNDQIWEITFVESDIITIKSLSGRNVFHSGEEVYAQSSGDVQQWKVVGNIDGPVELYYYNSSVTDIALCELSASPNEVKASNSEESDKKWKIIPS